MSGLPRLPASVVCAAFRLAVIALAIYGGLDLSRSALAQEDRRAYVPYTSQPATFEELVAALEYKLAHVVASSDAITVTGVNLWVVNGTGTTDGEPNGLGNVVVGYGEERPLAVNDRSGSHMVVVGMQHNSSAFGGIVVGQLHTVTGDFASVSGGWGNTSSGWASSVSGGSANASSGNWASISGGEENEASEGSSSIRGGYQNAARPVYSAISGGIGNLAFGRFSSVSGGQNRTAPGEDDWAAGSLLEER